MRIKRKRKKKESQEGDLRASGKAEEEGSHVLPPATIPTSTLPHQAAQCTLETVPTCSWPAACWRPTEQPLGGWKGEESGLPRPSRLREDMWGPDRRVAMQGDQPRSRASRVCLQPTDQCSLSQGWSAGQTAWEYRAQATYPLLSL